MASRLLFDKKFLLYNLRDEAMEMITMATGQSFEGLAQAARYARKSHLLHNKVCRDLQNLDTAYNVVRHLDSTKSSIFTDQLHRALSGQSVITLTRVKPSSTSSPGSGSEFGATASSTERSSEPEPTWPSNSSHCPNASWQGDEYYSIICADAEAQTEFAMLPTMHPQCDVATQTVNSNECGDEGARKTSDSNWQPLHSKALSDMQPHVLELFPLLNSNEDANSDMSDLPSPTSLPASLPSAGPGVLSSNVADEYKPIEPYQLPLKFYDAGDVPWPRTSMRCCAFVDDTFVEAFGDTVSEVNSGEGNVDDIADVLYEALISLANSDMSDLPSPTSLPASLPSAGPGVMSSNVADADFDISCVESIAQTGFAEPYHTSLHASFSVGPGVSSSNVAMQNEDNMADVGSGHDHAELTQFFKERRLQPDTTRKEWWWQPVFKVAPYELPCILLCCEDANTNATTFYMQDDAESDASCDYDMDPAGPPLDVVYICCMLEECLATPTHIASATPYSIEVKRLEVAADRYNEFRQPTIPHGSYGGDPIDEALPQLMPTFNHLTVAEVGRAMAAGWHTYRIFAPAMAELIEDNGGVAFNPLQWLNNPPEPHLLMPQNDVPVLLGASFGDVSNSMAHDAYMYGSAAQDAAECKQQ